MRDKHPLAGQTVILHLRGDNHQGIDGQPFKIEDWWENVSGGSWVDAVSNFTTTNYSFRVGANGIPVDDDVVYGKVGFLGYLIHVSELGEVTK